MFQSTHPYRVWPSVVRAARVRIVSIHTPIQGVTFGQDFLVHYPSVSIHTPIQGVTDHRFKYRFPHDGFNPHTHTGCDAAISNNLLNHPCFNPHTHTGCDFGNLDYTKVSQQFQSTHPYRVWQDADDLIEEVIKVSIHTPIQGVTCALPYTTRCPCVSIHTPIQGVT